MLLDDGCTWVFPANVAGARMITNYTGYVYAVQLHCRADDDHADADGVWGATMGHGLVKSGGEAQKRDIRDHVFYRNYDAVAASLDALPKDEDGLALGAGVERTPRRGWLRPISLFRCDTLCSLSPLQSRIKQI